MKSPIIGEKVRFQPIVHCILIFSFSEWIWFVGENPDIDANVDLKKNLMDLFSSMENLAKEIGENGPASSNSAALMVNDGESKRRVSTCSGYSIFTGKFKKLDFS